MAALKVVGMLAALIIGAAFVTYMIVEFFAVPGWEDETGFHHGVRPGSLPDERLHEYGIGSDPRPEIHHQEGA